MCVCVCVRVCMREERMRNEGNRRGEEVKTIHGEGLAHTLNDKGVEWIVDRG